MTILKSGLLLLRPWQPGDEDSLIKYGNNKKIAMNLRDRFPQPYTQKDAEEWINIAGNQTPKTNFAIVVDGHAVGGIGLMLGDDVFRLSAELGYWLGEPYWGKNITTEAVKLVTGYGFDTLSLVRIHAGVFDWNPASGRVLEKAGFTLESRMEKAVVKDGQILDLLNYVKIR